MGNLKKRRFTGRTATAIILKSPDKILLVKRLTVPFSGYWALPGGRLDSGETVEATIIREVQEETGLKVIIERKIGEYREIGVQDEIEYDYSPACFLVKIIGGKLKRQENEIGALKFFSLANIPKVIAFEHNTMVRDYVNSLKKDDVIHKTLKKILIKIASKKANNINVLR